MPMIEQRGHHARRRGGRQPRRRRRRPARAAVRSAQRRCARRRARRGARRGSARRRSPGPCCSAATAGWRCRCCPINRPGLKYEHMFAFICWVQLALDALDRLVDTLEERGPLTAVEAARSLFATSSISDGLACSLLAGRHRGRQPAPLHRRDGLLDRRTHGSAARGRRARGLRPRDDRALGDAGPDLRVRRGARPGARGRRLLSVARQSGHRAPGSRRAPHRPARAGAAARASCLERPPPLPRLRGRFAPRRPQRALRPALPRAAATAPTWPALVGAAALHGRARPSSARGPATPRRSRLARRLLRRGDEALPPRPARCRGDRRGARSPDRACAGARGKPAIRPPGARGPAQAPGLRQALARPRCAHSARRLLLP